VYVINKIFKYAFAAKSFLFFFLTTSLSSNLFFFFKKKKSLVSLENI